MNGAIWFSFGVSPDGFELTGSTKIVSESDFGGGQFPSHSIIVWGLGNTDFR